MSNLLAAAKQLTQAMQADERFIATVSAVSSHSVKVIRPGQTAADNTYYPSLDNTGSTFVAGDVVAVVKFGATWIVIGKVTS